MIAALDEFNARPSPPTSGAARGLRPRGNPLAKIDGVVVNRSGPTPAMEIAAAQRTDHALMLAVRDGELDALGELFERHHRPLFGFLVKLTGNRSVAEDIAQTVFQRMLKYRHTYRDDGSFTAWMYHLARRCAADQYRRDQQTPHAIDPAELSERSDDVPHAADRATLRDDRALLQTALGQLGREDREVLLLARFQELSFAEIAGILDCSVGAAKVRAHRALKELRDVYFQLLGERGPKPPLSPTNRPGASL